MAKSLKNRIGKPQKSRRHKKVRDSHKFTDEALKNLDK